SPTGLLSTQFVHYLTIPSHHWYINVERAWIQPIVQRFFFSDVFQIEICLSYMRSIFVLFNWARFGSLIAQELTLALLLSGIVGLQDTTSTWILKCNSTFFSILTFFVYYNGDAASLRFLNILVTSLFFLRIWSNWVHELEVP